MVRENFNTERQKKVYARQTCAAKIYMPTVKIYLPRAFGQCYVLALRLVSSMASSVPLSSKCGCIVQT